MATLIPLSDLVRDRNYDFKTDNVYDPTGDPAYGQDGHKIGTVRGAMVDSDSGKLRYLIVDVGGWFVSKEVLVPVGMARIEDDAVYFDNLTKDQVKDMREYRAGDDYDYGAQTSDERVLRGASYTNYDTGNSVTAVTDTDLNTGATTGVVVDRDLSVVGGNAELAQTGTTDVGYNAGSTGAMSGDTSARRYNYRDEDASDTMFKTPQRLQLLEERLTVDKDRYTAGSVEIGKHVETRQQQVNVDLSREEVVIERRPVSGAQPVEGNVTLGSASETIRVDLEAERADVRKQAYVTEEVQIGKRTETETQTFTESVGREVLDVNKTGDVEVAGDATLTDAERNRNSNS